METMMADAGRFFKIVALLAMALVSAAIFAACSGRSFDGEEGISMNDSVLPPVTLGTEVYESDGVTLDLSSKEYGRVIVSCARNTDKRYKVRSACGDDECFYDISSDGEPIAIPLQFGNGEYEIRVYEQLEGQNYSPIFSKKFTAELLNEFVPFLYPSVIVNYDDESSCVSLARRLCSEGDAGNDKLKKLYNYVVRNTTYDDVLADEVAGKSGYIPNPDETLAKRTGICYDYSALLAAMLRTQKVPTRLVMGYLSDGQYHAWNEVYVGGEWVLADSTLDGQGYKDGDYFPTKIY